MSRRISAAERPGMPTVEGRIGSGCALISSRSPSSIVLVSFASSIACSGIGGAPAWTER